MQTAIESEEAHPGAPLFLFNKAWDTKCQYAILLRLFGMSRFIHLSIAAKNVNNTATFSDRNERLTASLSN